MFNSSTLIGELTIEEFIPVIVAGVAMFILLVAFVFGVAVLISWALSKCLELDVKSKQCKDEKLKRECVEEVLKYYDEVYKRLGDGDDAEKRK